MASELSKQIGERNATNCWYGQHCKNVSIYLYINKEALTIYVWYLLYTVHMEWNKCTVYRIAQLFGDGKPWWIWWIIGGSPNFTIQILTRSCNINKEANKQEFAQVSFAKSFWWEIRQVFLHQTFALYGMSSQHCSFKTMKCHLSSL